VELRTPPRWPRHRPLGGLALAALLALATPSRAAAQEPAPAPEMSWYGYGPLAIDSAAMLVALVGLANIKPCNPPDPCPNNTEGRAWLAIAGGSYLLAGPLIHLRHGHDARAAYSLLARAAPLLGTLLVSDRAAKPIVLWGTIGAIILDDGFVAHEAAAARGGQLVVPMVDPVGRGGGLALAGGFLDPSAAGLQTRAATG
jgi:hypothetical protein